MSNKIDKFFDLLNIKTITVCTCVLFVFIFLTLNSARGLATSNMVPIKSVVSNDAADLYTANCSECHGTDGKAKTSKGKRTGATDFTSDWNRDEDRGYRIIRNGKGEMPSFKRKLSSQNVRDIFEYIQKFKK